ncbi:hypothetical protein [uncultured Erythrobacter sp.]|uniref:hypothetical protein n=1 Tax=uncultured Erythrobacter sp. TaxID=263913 RepID=UPI002629A11D|nr:hypothetical protein [uncultured Erythrobacter sp.]
MFEAVIADLAELGPIGLIVLFVTLTGVTGTSIIKAIRLQTRTGQLEQAKEGLEADLAREKNDRLKAERRAEAAEQLTKDVSPEGTALRIDSLFTRSRFADWEKAIETAKGRDKTNAHILFKRAAHDLAMLSSRDDLEEAALEIEQQLKASFSLNPNEESLAANLLMEVQRMRPNLERFFDESTHASYISPVNAAVPDTTRLSKILSDLSKNGLFMSALMTGERAFKIVEFHEEKFDPFGRFVRALNYLNATRAVIDYMKIPEFGAKFPKLERFCRDAIADMPVGRAKEEEVFHLYQGLAMSHLTVGEFEKAINYQRASVEKAEQLFGKGSAELAGQRGGLVHVLVDCDSPDVELAREVVQEAIDRYGPVAQSTLTTRFWLGRSLEAANRFEEAEREFSELVPLKRKHKGERHYDTLSAEAILERLRMKLGMVSTLTVSYDTEAKVSYPDRRS